MVTKKSELQDPNLKLQMKVNTKPFLDFDI